MTRRTAQESSLENLKKEAKRWLKALRDGSPDARARLERIHPTAAAQPALRDVQHALAREHGFAGWTALKAALRNRKQHEIATALVGAYDGDSAALDRLRQ